MCVLRKHASFMFDLAPMNKKAKTINSLEDVNSKWHCTKLDSFYNMYFFAML